MLFRHFRIQTIFMIFVRNISHFGQLYREVWWILVPLKKKLLCGTCDDNRKGGYREA